MADRDAISFLGEEDYLAAMEGPCAQWLRDDVTEADLQSFDGTRLHYYTASPPQARACVVMVHGFCEFFGKFHETAWYFYRAGYRIFFMEQRGHGLSEGKIEDRDMVYIDDFDTYVRDLHTLMEQVVLPDTTDLKKIVFAHSMGGAVTALYLETHPEVFDAAFLSSPMFRLRGGDYSAPKLMAIDAYAGLFRKKKQFAPGQHHFSPVMGPVEPTQSAARQEYIFRLRAADWHYQTSGASFGWAIASVKAMKRLLRDADRIRIPVTLITAGQDTLVSPEGHDIFAEKVPQTVRLFYEASGHEIYNATTDMRTRYYADVLDRFASISDEFQ